MPTVICPGCGREIRLPAHELSLLSITCARCDTVFVPSTGQLPAPVVPDDSPAEYAPLAPPRRANSAFVAVLIAAGLVFLAVLGLFMSRSPGSHRALQSKPSRASQDSAANDPYAPDCDIIRAWLKNQYGEVEVVSWGKRNIHRFAQLDDHVTLSVRFRLKGERRTKSGYFVIGAGDIVQSAHISD